MFNIDELQWLQKGLEAKKYIHVNINNALG